MMKIRYDNRDLMEYFENEPKQSRYAMNVALKMTGGHVRKQMKRDIENDVENWEKLHPISDHGETPLKRLGGMVSFRYRSFKGAQMVQIGFLGKRAAQLARELGYGKRIRVTDAIREYFVKRGFPLRKVTKTLRLPARPIIDPFIDRSETEILSYLERNFIEKWETSIIGGMYKKK